MSLRSPLGVVLGRGAAGEGASHWWAQRMSALALLPLTVWFVAALIRLPLSDYAAVTVWIMNSWNPLWLTLLLLAVCWHSALGVQVVIEDYVHAHALKTASLILSGAVHLLLLAAGLFAVLRLAVRGLA